MKITIDFLKQVTQDDENGDIKSTWKVMLDFKALNDAKDVMSIPFIYLSHSG